MVVGARGPGETFLEPAHVFGLSAATARCAHCLSLVLDVYVLTEHAL